LLVGGDAWGVPAPGVARPGVVTITGRPADTADGTTTGADRTGVRVPSIGVRLAGEVASGAAGVAAHPPSSITGTHQEQNLLPHTCHMAILQLCRRAASVPSANILPYTAERVVVPGGYLGE